MKRLGIFVFYDANGIVDNYVTHLLSQMSKVLDKLVIVSNTHLHNAEKDKLLAFTADYFERENTGLDAGAYQDVLCNLIGWSKVRQYDELTLFNDTYYGFFCPADHIFDIMAIRKCDFWGITLQFSIPEYSIPEHVQSYFIVIKSKLLHDLAFENWWQNYIRSNDLWETIKKFELSFTEHFANLGYTYSSYVDTSIWKDEATGHCINFQGDRQYRLLTECECPVLKRRNISRYPQIFSDDAIKSIHYISEYTNYDTNLIWNNLLRLYEVSLMHKSLHFNTSIPDTPQTELSTSKTTMLFIVTNKYSISLLKYYIDSIKANVVYIFSKTEEIFNSLCDCGLRKKFKIYKLNENENPFLLINQDSDFYFYLTDETEINIDLVTTDKMRIHNLDSLIKSQHYLENLLLYMQKNEKIGLLMPENLAKIFGGKTSNWKFFYPIVKNILQQLDLAVPISEEVTPFAHSNCFCAKRSAIRQLFDAGIFSSQDFYKTLPYVLLYVVQANGYITEKIFLPHEVDGIVEQSLSTLNVVKSELEEKQQHNIQQQNQITILKKELNNVYNSWSWKLSKPLRIADCCARKILTQKSKLLSRRQNSINQENKGNEISNSYDSYISEYEKQKKTTFSHRIKFSIVVPLYNTDSRALKEMILSVMSQSYQNWELCLLDASDASNDYVGLLCKNTAKDDPRIIYKKAEENDGISGNTNAAIAMATGDYIALLDHDDLLTPDALFENAKAINEYGAKALYSDEIRLSESGKFTHPFYKPDWSPDLLYSQNYVCHFLVVKKELVSILQGFRSDFDGAQDYDFILRLSEKTTKIHHIAKVLYIWRESTTSTSVNAESKPYAHDAGRKALDEHLKRKYGCDSFASDGQYLFTYDARFPLKNAPLVSIIIPMKDRWELTNNCIESILQKTSYKNYEILILDNRSTKKKTFAWFKKIKARDSRITVLNADMEFNWSKLNNFGIKHAKGEVYVFLNNDTLVISEDWLTLLAENALRKGIGIVGAQLLYEDNTIQHAGVVVGIGRYADHIFKGMPMDHRESPFVSSQINRNVLAVTGACMSISKNTIQRIGKFDERFVICGSDVEICIRAHEAGLYNLYNAGAKLYHLESKSRDSYIPDIDFKMSEKYYAPYINHNDPFFNKNLQLTTTPQEQLDITEKRQVFYDYYFKLLYTHWQTNDFLKTVELIKKISQTKDGITSCVDIGGPSDLFYPIYDIAGTMDIVNFSMKNTWGTLSNDYHYKDRLMGKVIENDATDLKDIQNEAYDVVLSSNNLEHIANPIKAVKEWVRILKPDGMLIILVPAKEYTFDHKRKIVSFNHLLDDLKNDVKEDDLTHLDEILFLHDLSMDPGAGKFDQFKKRSMKNFENRCLHQHVFDCNVLRQIATYFSMEILFSDEQYGSNWMLVARKRK